MLFLLETNVPTTRYVCRGAGENLKTFGRMDYMYLENAGPVHQRAADDDGKCTGPVHTPLPVPGRRQLPLVPQQLTYTYLGMLQVPPKRWAGAPVSGR